VVLVRFEENARLAARGGEHGRGMVPSPATSEVFDAIERESTERENRAMQREKKNCWLKPNFNSFGVSRASSAAQVVDLV
jgi:1,6-anhydro-N-acetylmuramate kinase